MICQRCYEEDAVYRVVTDVMDVPVCPSCAEQARELKLTTEDLSDKEESSIFNKPH